jgi:hypothetical protein
VWNGAGKNLISIKVSFFGYKYLKIFRRQHCKKLFQLMRNLQARVVLIRFKRSVAALAEKHGKHFYVSNLNYRKVSNCVGTLPIFPTRAPTSKMAPTPLNNAATHQNWAQDFPFLGVRQQTLAMPCMLRPVYPLSPDKLCALSRKSSRANEG